MVFGVDDAIIAAAIAAAAKGAGDAMGASSSAKSEKRKSKETKRSTLADMYNQALKREHDESKFKREQSGNNTARRTAALQETASGFSKALLGR